MRPSNQNNIKSSQPQPPSSSDEPSEISSQNQPQPQPILKSPTSNSPTSFAAIVAASKPKKA